jgi:hypothetical protein
VPLIYYITERKKWESSPNPSKGRESESPVE